MRKQDTITLKALTTVETDEGTFEAVISTETVDREQDVVVADAMVKALRAWQRVGKMIPLAWEHSTEPNDIIGHIDPATVTAVDNEVVAHGWVDQSIERGQQAWRLVKSGTLGFSFGYLLLDSTKRSDGGRRITALDVFEVTATMTPMNGDTRVVGWKAIADTVKADDPERTTRDQLRAQLEQLGISATKASSTELRVATFEVGR